MKHRTYVSMSECFSRPTRCTQVVDGSGSGNGSGIGEESRMGWPAQGPRVVQGMVVGGLVGASRLALAALPSSHGSKESPKRNARRRLLRSKCPGFPHDTVLYLLYCTEVLLPVPWIFTTPIPTTHHLRLRLVPHFPADRT
jgi:hypothetical protein